MPEGGDTCATGLHLAFFVSVDQKWLFRFVEHQIGDQRIIRQIRQSCVLMIESPTRSVRPMRHLRLLTAGGLDRTVTVPAD